jgi:hypothetical protein
VGGSNLKGLEPTMKQITFYSKAMLAALAAAQKADATKKAQGL